MINDFDNEELVEQDKFKYNMTNFNFMPSFSVHRISDTDETFRLLNEYDIFLDSVSKEDRFKAYSIPIDY